jgi:4-diphosphocytidyl-2-C-methyl-D-erythritol kinase
MSVRVRVPAKINMHLGVGARRPDGYHELTTVFTAVDLCDDVTAAPSTGLSLQIDGAPELPADDRNLAWRAAVLLAKAAGVPGDVALTVRKRIPIAGGLAGGSADAAATLVACARLWQVQADLPALAAQLGSDVAFLLLGGTAVGTGRGERLRSVPTATELHWVLVIADYGISTAGAYAALAERRAAGGAPAPIGSPDVLLAALAAGDVAAAAGALAKDLQPAALTAHPELQATLDAGVSAGALAGLVSGSGPTCAFLCPDADAAHAIAARLTDGGRRALAVTGPAPGAHVLD